MSSSRPARPARSARSPRPARPAPSSRYLLGVLGALVICYGAWLLLSREDLADVVQVGIWLGAGLVLHDVILSALLLVLGALTIRLLPRHARGAVAAGVVVLGTVTVMAVPVLGRFGAKPLNPTLLDRSYILGWLLLAALVAVGVAAVVLVRRHRVGGG